MKRKLGVIGLVVVAVGGVLVWRCHAPGRGGVSSAAKAIAHDARAPIGQRVDPRKLQRASIAGTITDEDHAVVPRAHVCAELSSRAISAQLTREPKCTTADERGRYKLGELFTGTYVVAASAKPYRPSAYHPNGDRDERSFELAAAEHKTGIDIVLRKGGVEITGTVSDVTGGPIAHALVSEDHRWGRDDFAPPVETEADGTFSLWVKPGDTSLTAQAEGYASGADAGSAPGTFEILLTPESSLSGTVVDAKTGQPVAGVPVNVSEGDWFSFGNASEPSDITDDQGKFHVSALQPGRYVASVHGARSFGRTDGSTLVGLGQHVEGVIVKVHAGYQLSGKVVLPNKTTCKHAHLYLADVKTDYSANTVQEPDGTVHADGMLPGSYHVGVDCNEYQARDKYPPVEIKDRDVVGMVWEVDAGGAIQGRVVTKAGTPIEDARVSARTIGGAARAKTGWNSDTSLKDGSFALSGLKAGTYRLSVSAEKYNGPKDGWKIDVAPGARVQKDLVLDDGGSIKGVVVDAQQKPVGAVQVMAEGVGGSSWGSSVRTNADGTFQLDGVRQGDYVVIARHGWWSDDLRKPGSTDDDKQGEKVSVVVGKVANVRLVVEAQSGVIEGTVVDPGGKPVSDAFVSAARESDAAGARSSSINGTRWSWDEKPVVSNLDGKFRLQKLSPGKYTLRAYRKGGGEAVAEHVAVGGTTTLQIRATGIIEGTVRRPGGKLDELQVALADDKTGLNRRETFFRTDGKYVIRDLPTGNFMLTASTAGGKKQLAVALAEGEHKSGVDVTLDELVTITGRVVDFVTKQPVAGMRMLAQIGKINRGFGWRNTDDEQKNISGDDGRFTIEQAPRGPILIRGMPKDWNESEYAWLEAVRDVGAGASTADIGDVMVLKKRIKRGEVAGELGIKFAQDPVDTPVDQQTFKVSYIDAKGPAAKTELKVGDVVTTIDGIEVTGASHSSGWTLMRAAPGTAIKLGLQRGASVTIVLAAP